MTLTELNTCQKMLGNSSSCRRRGDLSGRHETVLTHCLCERLRSGCHVITGGFYDGSVAGFHFCGAGGGESFESFLPNRVAEHLQGVAGDDEVVVAEAFVALGGDHVAAGGSSSSGAVLFDGRDLDHVVGFEGVEVAAYCCGGEAEELTEGCCGYGAVVEDFAQDAVPGAFFCLGFALGCACRGGLCTGSTSRARGGGSGAVSGLRLVR